MDRHKLATVLFYNSKGEILIWEKPVFKTGSAYRLFGGHIEAGETPRQALAREIREQLSINIKRFRVFKHYRHIDKNFNLDLIKFVFLCEMPEPRPIANAGNSKKTTFAEALKMDFSYGDKTILKEIRTLLKNQNMIP